MLSLFPEIAYRASSLLGFQAPINFVYLVIIAVLIVNQFAMTIRISQMDSKVRKLAQRVALNEEKIELFTSQDSFASIKQKTLASDMNFIAPRVFRNSAGGFTIFASHPDEDSFSLYYATSNDGENWSSFAEFTVPFQVKNTYNPIAPFLAPSKGGDIVVYQCQYSESNLISIQLFQPSRRTTESHGQSRFCFLERNLRKTESSLASTTRILL